MCFRSRRSSSGRGGRQRTGRRRLAPPARGRGTRRPRTALPRDNWLHTTRRAPAATVHGRTFRRRSPRNGTVPRRRPLRPHTVGRTRRNARSLGRDPRRRSRRGSGLPDSGTPLRCTVDRGRTPDRTPRNGPGSSRSPRTLRRRRHAPRSRRTRPRRTPRPCHRRRRSRRSCGYRSERPCRHRRTGQGTPAGSESSSAHLLTSHTRRPPPRATRRAQKRARLRP